MTIHKHPLDEIKWKVIPRIVYRGVYVTKQLNGLYKVGNHPDLSKKRVDEHIDKTIGVIGKSIVN